MKVRFSIVIFFLLISHLSFGQAIGDTNAVHWDYPIKAGTEEWAALKTWDARYDACQIPLAVLDTISTKELVQVCLNYPPYATYELFFKDEREGITFLIKRFNGLWELTQRKDGVSELIKAYIDYPVLSQFEKDKNSKNYFAPLRLSFLELVLADSLFLNQLNTVELDEFKQIVINKYADKVQNSNVYGLSSIKNTLLLATIVIDEQKIEKSTKQQETITNFIKNYRYAESNLVIEISNIIIAL